MSLVGCLAFDHDPGALDLHPGRNNPPLRESVLIGKESGFKPVIDVFWYMNPEFAINMFPHPYIQRGSRRRNMPGMS